MAASTRVDYSELYRSIALHGHNGRQGCGLFSGP